MIQPLHLIDRFTELAPPDRLRGVKAPSFGEQLFEDHFAGFPLMPGALMVEAMVQGAQWLARIDGGFPVADFPVVRVERAVFSGYVRPGSVMEVQVDRDAPLAYRGVVKVEGRKMASARLELSRRDLDGQRSSVRRALERIDEAFDLLGGPGLLAAREEGGRT
ncbi:MAG: hypothetical protein HY814_14610 [Candidatus Riflebacteria bacterium]|nr:hypothetical protein [Candidatus Riflebacteria bacterium]